MGVRSKMKKAFGSKRSGDNSSSDGGTPPIPGVQYYKPGEVPKPKYRGKLDQGHQDKLLAFSFAAAFRSRRGSGYSDYSPAGTKSQSPRASYAGRELKSGAGDRSLPRKSNIGSGAKGDDEDDDDVDNVGLSKPITAGGRAEITALVDGFGPNRLQLEKSATSDETYHTSDTPFTAEELTRALTAAKWEEKAL